MLGSGGGGEAFFSAKDLGNRPELSKLASWWDGAGFAKTSNRKSTSPKCTFFFFHLLLLLCYCCCLRDNFNGPRRKDPFRSAVGGEGKSIRIKNLGSSMLACVRRGSEVFGDADGGRRKKQKEQTTSDFRQWGKKSPVRTYLLSFLFSGK